MKKILWTLLSALIVIVVAGGFAYAYMGDSQLFDRLYSPEEQELRKLNRAAKDFPSQIGNYALFSGKGRPIQFETECNTINGEESCVDNIRAEYHQIDGNKTIFVSLLTFSKGKGSTTEYLRALGKSAVIQSYPYEVYRLEAHELGWFPKNTYDFVLTQEGTYTLHTDGGESVTYKNQATGENAVATYFIQKYPPVLE